MTFDNGQKTPAGKFAIGNPGGPGRPLGARSRLSEDFLEAVYQEFQKGGQAALEKVRQDDPATFIKVVASLVPRGLELSSRDGSTPLVVVYSLPSNGRDADIIEAEPAES